MCVDVCVYGVVHGVVAVCCLLSTKYCPFLSPALDPSVPYHTLDGREGLKEGGEKDFLSTKIQLMAAHVRTRSSFHSISLIFFPP